MESEGITTPDALYQNEMKYGDFTEANFWDHFKNEIGVDTFDNIMTSLQTKMKTIK